MREMATTTMLVELAEKMGLLAAAALLAVLYPPLRKRVLGEGDRKDKLAAALFGLVLSIWGALLGFEVSGEHFNVRAIGVLIAALLGGPKAGLLAGFGGGLFYASRVDLETAPWVLVASMIDGGLAGLLAKHRPDAVKTAPRVFAVSIGIQAIHIVLVGLALLAIGHAERYVPAWPAHLVKLLVNAAGVALFVAVARVVVAREEQAVALSEARAAADHAALEALRRRLEPHFLFNALTAVRATIRRDPDRARELVTDLADLYRYLLSHPDHAPLASEIEHASSYLAIERARLGEDRLRVESDVPEALGRELVPALLLQPLVENAVKHGIARHAGPGLVRMSAHRDARDRLVIEVVNESEGEVLPPPERDDGAGIALRTLRERLSRGYGEDAELTLEVTESRAIARVSMPRSRAALRASASETALPARNAQPEGSR
ncbi:MAG: histidine kinase [Deltaproteobacteria bacterium]|nr:histidine kinase [Deltaproteobacteria bacterium]